MEDLTRFQEIKYKLLSDSDKKVYNDLVIKENKLKELIEEAGTSVPHIMACLPQSILFMKTRKRLVGLNSKDKVALKKLQAFNLLNFRKKRAIILK